MASDCFAFSNLIENGASAFRLRSFFLHFSSSMIALSFTVQTYETLSIVDEWGRESWRAGFFLIMLCVQCVPRFLDATNKC